MPLLTTAEAAKVLTVTKGALQKWRMRGGGPPYLKVGTAVRYDSDDLRSWLAARRVTEPR